MTTRDLAEVSARLAKCVESIPGEPATPQELFDRWEATAIQILDSEFGDYCPGALEEYLLAILYQKQLELGLHPDYPESE